LTESDCDFAAKAILGELGNYLPIIYISTKNDDSHIIDPIKLAYWVSGLAHVVVEPNRRFSFELNKLTFSQNAYGGVIGLHWPDSLARKKYFLDEETNTGEKLQKRISFDIQAALSNKRQHTQCTWINLKEHIAKSRYEKLKNSGSTAVDEYIKSFDIELSAKQEIIDEANQEIDKLRKEIRKYNSDKTGKTDGVISYGKEVDLYPNEIKNTIIDSLTSYVKNNTLQNSRKNHVLSDIVGNNQFQCDAEDISSTIRKIFNDYTSMTPKIKSELLKMGFDISDEGKHHKVIFQGDSRYIFTLSKTASDHRTGKNFASDVIKKIF